MRSIKFEIPGTPQGKARARTVRNKFSGKTVSFTPDKTVNYENLIKICFLQMRPVGFKRIESQVKMQIVAHYRKAKANKMDVPMLKPDIDNLCKVVLDSLNDIAYIDDKQVIDISLSKVWANGNDEKVVVMLQY